MTVEELQIICYGTILFNGQSCSTYAIGNLLANARSVHNDSKSSIMLLFMRVTFALLSKVWYLLNDFNTLEFDVRDFTRNLNGGDGC